MEYTALFIWLTLCLLLGGLVHYVMAGAMSHRFVLLLSAPGLIIRKFTMTLAALVFGGTVTRVRLYELRARDIDYTADGAAGVAKVMVPLAPLFGCAVVMVGLNAAFGSPLMLNYQPPSLASLDTGGLQGFVHGTWVLLSSGVRQVIRSDWHSLNLYVLFALIFSLALGACSQMSRVREAVLGAALVAVTLALFSSIAVRRAGVVAGTPGWFAAIRTFVVSSSGVAFIMMVYGMLTALIVGFTVRIYELVTRTSPGRPAKTTSLTEDDEVRRAA